MCFYSIYFLSDVGRLLHFVLFLVLFFIGVHVAAWRASAGGNAARHLSVVLIAAAVLRRSFLVRAWQPRSAGPPPPRPLDVVSLYVGTGEPIVGELVGCDCQEKKKKKKKKTPLP